MSAGYRNGNYKGNIFFNNSRKKKSYLLANPTVNLKSKANVKRTT